MDTEIQCATVARLYAAMAETDDSIFSHLFANAAKRWWFYRRVARQLGRGLRYDETERLYERCCARDFTIWHVSESVALVRKMIR